VASKYVRFATRESLPCSERIRGRVVPRASFRAVVNTKLSASALNRDLISRMCVTTGYGIQNFVGVMANNATLSLLSFQHRS